METKLNVLETGYDELGLLILDENEAVETDGGDHYEYINEVLTLVKD